jgi:hypothetical protein
LLQQNITESWSDAPSCRPDIVEAILGGRQPAKLQVKELLRRFPVGWRKQRAEMFDPN